MVRAHAEDQLHVVLIDLVDEYLPVVPTRRQEAGLIGRTPLHLIDWALVLLSGGDELRAVVIGAGIHSEHIHSALLAAGGQQTTVRVQFDVVLP